MSSKSPRKTSALFISLGMGMTVVAIVALVIGFFLLQLPEPLIDHRITEVLEACLRHERKKANSCAVEGEAVLATVHTYGELLLERILTKNKEESDGQV